MHDPLCLSVIADNQNDNQNDVIDQYIQLGIDAFVSLLAVVNNYILSEQMLMHGFSLLNKW